jgi:beta-galactosidase
MSKLSRRRFLQTTAAVSTAASVAPSLSFAKVPDPIPYPENGTLLPDAGWRIWIDSHAPWKEDDIFLPDQITWANNQLCADDHPLPINPPTGGWSALTPTTGLEVLLPTTVEQHFWGKYGAGPNGKPRPCTPEEYRYAAPEYLSSLAAPTTNLSSRPAPPPNLSSRPESASFADGAERPAAPSAAAQLPIAIPPADDNIPQNGAYFGVSWWHRPIDIPASMRGKRIFLHIRSARLRAEVYLNGKLCGYSIMEELPFEADLTHAANPGGENHLAIRITNPFGRFDWVDGSNAKWGHLALYRSHGFGGLDRGITLSAHSDARFKDLWVLNEPDTHSITAYAVIEDPRGASHVGNVHFEIVDPRTGKVVASHSAGAPSASGQITIHPMIIEQASETTQKVSVYLTVDHAESWDLSTARLYHLRARVINPDLHTDTRTIAFGFRWFAPTGLGTNALFRLNGRRIRIYSAISWGYWGLNGLFPIPELAKKEVVAAKTLGLNCLNFHRNLAKEDVLRQHDQLGLLRYMEPGGGKLAIGKLPANADVNAASIVMQPPKSEADKFAQRFTFTKCVEMVKAFRSHPSVIEYCVQNEIGADLKNPATEAVLAAMRAEDPSRCIVLNDGFVARGAAQAWYAPYDPKLYRSDEEPWGDWWNNHQGAGDQWYDQFYKSPTDYTYQAPFKQYLTEFGEMEGCARPDNHPLMVHQITQTYKQYGGTSYDLLDHQEIIAGYDRFLDKWGFRKAFPTAESVFLACGRTCYDSWQNYLENVRISDWLDFAAISGWESTAIENHSGIVDNLRNFKSDPKLLAGSLLPIRPIAKQRTLVIAQGQPATFDLYLANDTPHPATGTLTFSMIAPSGKRSELLTLPAPAQTPDIFSYLLREAFTTPPLTEEGLYRFKFSITSSPLSTQTKELWVNDVSAHSSYDECKAARIGVSGIAPAFRKQLDAIAAANGCLEILDFEPDQSYRAIISSGLTAHTTATQSSGETTGNEPLPTAKPGHKPEPGEAPQPTEIGHLDPAILEAARAGTPLLCVPESDTLSDGCARQLADAGAFTFHGNVGDLRAPWMGNWYFVREHPLFAGMLVNQAMGNFYQAPGRQSNGLLIDKSPTGGPVEIVVAYSRDHDRNIGAGTFTTTLGRGKVLYHRVPPMHPVMQQRFLANALRWLTA